jgi:hypothetical protein
MMNKMFKLILREEEEVGVESDVEEAPEEEEDNCIK